MWRELRCVITEVLSGKEDETFTVNQEMRAKRSVLPRHIDQIKKPQLNGSFKEETCFSCWPSSREELGRQTGRCFNSASVVTQWLFKIGNCGVIMDIKIGNLLQLVLHTWPCLRLLSSAALSSENLILCPAVQLFNTNFPLAFRAVVSHPVIYPHSVLICQTWKS